MLEDGEIDEEDFEPTTVETTITDNTPTADTADDAPNNKRKTRETKLSKRKKQAKGHKNGHRSNGHSIPINELDSNEENSNGSEMYEQRRDRYIHHEDRANFQMNKDLQMTNKPPSLLGLHPPPSLLGIQSHKPKLSSLMSATPNPSTWSGAQTTQKAKDSAPKSLFDLFLGSTSSINNTLNQEKEKNFADPIITEKENNKPLKGNKSKFQHQHQQRTANFNNELKRKSDDESEGTGNLISIESIEKKLEKKRRYTEIHKEKLKKQEQNPQPKVVREPIICKFFLEGRCQKGSDCQFSHNTILNKKLEPCKFYLNGFCAKNDKCLFMHGDFPCKFFHRKNTNPNKMNCIHGDQCRFSHEPITDTLLLEAFNKHIAETTTTHNNNPNNPESSTDTMNKSNTSLLGSPPRTLPLLIQKPDQDRPPSLMSLMSVNIPKSHDKPPKLTSPNTTSPPPPHQQPVINVSMPPPVRNGPFKKTLLATPPNMVPSLLNNSILPSAFGGGSGSGDVDERSSAAIPHVKRETNIPLTIIQSNDIDERSILQQITATASTAQPPPAIINTTKPPPSLQVPPPQAVTVTPQIDAARADSLKQELIIKIMKAIADGDSGNSSDAFAKLPKNTLTELLVKLLNDKDNLVGIDVITNLLHTLGGSVNKQEQPDIKQIKYSNMNQNTRSYGDNEDEDDDLPITLRSDSLNESSSNLQIDLNSSLKKNKRKYGDGNYSDYDNDDEYDDDEEENALVIEGTLEHEMDYKLIELDIEPSKLWTCPPAAVEEAVFTPGEHQDQECDPRIKYYQDKENCNNIANYQMQLLQQNQLQQQQSQQQNTPTSPSGTTNSVTAILKQETIEQDSKSSTAATKKRIADPRLKNKNMNSSPTRSISPTPTKNDLISIQTRQLAGNSLLSQLPDLQFPKDIKNSNSFNNMTLNSQFQESSTVKLSIEDYKRKLHKPSSSTQQQSSSSASNLTSSSITDSTMSILSSLANGSTSSTATATITTTTTQNSTDFNSMNNSNALPSIPSFSLNLQAPQSLHELLRNFQS